ncbi:MAG TPA: hypothetical protein VM529_04855 [Gemmata sp.]|nr:hypothetical protein [Gemmata sp.]
MRRGLRGAPDVVAALLQHVERERFRRAKLHSVVARVMTLFGPPAM